MYKDARIDLLYYYYIIKYSSCMSHFVANCTLPLKRIVTLTVSIYKYLFTR